MKKIEEMTQIELAAFVQSHLSKKGMKFVLSGGAAASYYTDGQFVSMDIDLVADWQVKRRQVNKAMLEIGFGLRGKYYAHAASEHIVEILPGPPSFGEQSIGELIEIEIATGILRIINPSDCAKDRLAGYFYHRDTEALEQALLVVDKHKVNLAELDDWAEGKGMSEQYAHFRSRVDLS